MSDETTCPVCRHDPDGPRYCIEADCGCDCRAVRTAIARAVEEEREAGALALDALAASSRDLAEQMEARGFPSTADQHVLHAATYTHAAGVIRARTSTKGGTDG